MKGVCTMYTDCVGDAIKFILLSIFIYVPSVYAIATF